MKLYGRKHDAYSKAWRLDNLKYTGVYADETFMNLLKKKRKTTEQSLDSGKLNVKSVNKVNY